MTMIFNGTTGITFPDGQTQDVGVPDPGTNGNVLTSNGTIWTSAAPGTYSQWTTSGSNIFYNTGNVGIGTSSPAQLLQVAQGTKATTASAISSAGFTTTDAAGSTFGLFFRQKTDATAANRWTGIQSFDNGVGASNLVLQDLGGNVGIGTSSPLGILDVVASSGAVQRIRSSGTAGANTLYQNSNTGTTTSDGLYVGYDGTAGYLWNFENQPVILATNNTERMRIDSSGNVGIGTSSPSYKLQVAGNLYSNVSAAAGQNIDITGTNLNLLITPGSYMGYNLTNAPSVAGAAWVNVLVSSNGSDQVYQTAQPAQYISNSVWIRHSFNGGSTWNSWAKQSGTGSILQVLSTTKTDTFTTTSTSFTDITGLSVTITPSSTSSRIAVFCDTTITAGGGPGGFYGVRLMRDATPINVGAAAGSRTRASYGSITQSDDNMTKTGAFNFVDSPATTSATTYKLQAFVYSGGTICINRQFTDSDTTGFGRFASTITVMEIAG